ncbi:MAG: hypothetical protein PUA61_08465, partial [Succinatimonas hippei]|nr:hypothetical protein [Succinatimonas hippei]
RIIWPDIHIPYAKPQRPEKSHLTPVDIYADSTSHHCIGKFQSRDFQTHHRLILKKSIGLGKSAPLSLKKNVRRRKMRRAEITSSCCTTLARISATPAT